MLTTFLAHCHEHAPGMVVPMLAAWCALDLMGDILRKTAASPYYAIVS